MIWFHSPATVVIRNAPRSYMLEFLNWIYDHSPDKVFLSLCTTLWVAWFLRNKDVLTDERCDTVSVTAKFHKLVQVFNLYTINIQVPLRDYLLKFHVWNPPLETWVKVNFDANVTCGIRRGIGVVFRDNAGKQLVAGVRCIKAKWFPEVSEAATALNGVKVAVRFGYV